MANHKPAPDRGTDTDPGCDTDRGRAIGDELVQIHDALRAELAAVRTRLDTYLSGQPDRGPDQPAPSLGVQLRKHCLTICEALHRHHAREDDGMFGYLDQQYPELRPALQRLREEHQTVGRIIDDIQTLLATATPANAEQVRTHLHGLASELEAHFYHEEQQLVPALNTIGS